MSEQKIIKSAAVIFTGEPSVGIFGGTVTVADLEIELSETEREEFRKDLAQLFGDWFGEPPGVMFDDEFEDEFEDPGEDA